MLEVLDLGLAPYLEALAFQRNRRERRLAQDIPDALLLLEHPPVFTRGRGGSADEFIVSPQVLAARGFQIFDIERGGKTTYHGPGQMVGYPVVSLRALRLGVPEFVGLLEQCIIDFLADFELRATRRRGYPGVWVADRKIASIGIHLRQWVSMHGFALNLSPDLTPFAFIHPCGLPDVKVTSVQAEIGRAPPMADAKRAIAEHFRVVFGYPSLTWVEAGALR